MYVTIRFYVFPRALRFLSDIELLSMPTLDIDIIFFVLFYCLISLVTCNALHAKHIAYNILHIAHQYCVSIEPPSPASPDNDLLLDRLSLQLNGELCVIFVAPHHRLDACRTMDAMGAQVRGARFTIVLNPTVEAEVTPFPTGMNPPALLAG